jgi:phosphatidylethanolamine-binding protein (PEBP) family uncharacterized protein
MSFQAFVVAPFPVDRRREAVKGKHGLICNGVEPLDRDALHQGDSRLSPLQDIKDCGNSPLQDLYIHTSQSSENMQLLPLIAFVASATALAVPTPDIEERATCANANVLNLARAKKEFTEAKIVPDLIPEFKPTLEVYVDYNGKAVDFGNTFNTLGKSASRRKTRPIGFRLTKHAETTPEPNFSITRERLYDPSTTKYTLIMADPDAPNPSAPILKDFLHWIVSDVQPKCITTQKRKTVAPYMLPTPLSVAEHRYTFLVYRQPPNYVPPPSLNYLPGARAAFDLEAYVKEAKLEGPVGGNYYLEGLKQDLEIII